MPLQWTHISGTKYSKRDRRPVLSFVVQSLLAKYGAPILRGNAVVKLVRA